MSMIAAERQKAILEYLADHHVATTETLAQTTLSSVATIRRDLQVLADSGKLDRTHGGARKREGGGAALGGMEMMENIPFYEEKLVIARAAADTVLPDETVFLGAGQTCALLAREIKSVPRLRIVTTSISSVLELAGTPNQSIVLLGGDIHVGESHIETLDENTVNTIASYHFDRVFITVDGIDTEFGYSINSRRQMPLYTYLLSDAEEFSVLADHTKFGKRAFVRFALLSDVRHVFVDQGIDPQYLRALEDVGAVVTPGQELSS